MYERPTGLENATVEVPMKFFTIASLVLFFSFPAAAQDPAKVDSQHYKVIFEDTSICVLRLSYGPHEKSVMDESAAFRTLRRARAAKFTQLVVCDCHRFIDSDAFRRFGVGPGVGGDDLEVVFAGFRRIRIIGAAWDTDYAVRLELIERGVFS